MNKLLSQIREQFVVVHLKTQENNFPQSCYPVLNDTIHVKKLCTSISLTANISY